MAQHRVPLVLTNERDYSDIEQYDEQSTDDENEIAELNFESQDPDFDRDHSVAHTKYSAPKQKENWFSKNRLPSSYFLT